MNLWSLLHKVLSFLPFKKKMGWVGIVLTGLGILAQTYPQFLAFSLLANLIQSAVDSGVISVDAVSHLMGTIMTEIGAGMTALGYVRAKAREKVSDHEGV